MGCEKQNTNNIDDNDILVTTSDYGEEPYYYNLSTGLENLLDWHISLQEILVEFEGIPALFPMPNIITNSSTLIGIVSPDAYDDLTSVPENVEWLADTTLLSYQQPYVVLDYQFTCENPAHEDIHSDIHKIFLWDHTYLFKILETEKVYKLKFLDFYSNETIAGIVVFKYSELTIDNSNLIIM